MQILVTGANGFLGANLVRELVNRGETVKAFVRPSADISSLKNVDCNIFRGEVSSPDDVLRGLEDCDAVVHAAGTTSVKPEPFEKFKKINVDATENVVHAALRQGNKRLVYVSTANAFAPGSKKAPGDEGSPFPLLHLNDGYVNSKYMAQQCVLTHVKKNSLNAVIVNPTFMIGPYDSKPSSGKIVLLGLKKGIQWYPPGGKNFVHVADVAKGIYHALMSGRQGECYLLAGKNFSYKEFFQELNEVVGRKPIQILIPKPLLHFAGGVGEIWNAVSSRKVVLNLTNAKLLCLDNYYIDKKAKEEFNVTTTPIQAAIEESLEWFKNNRYVSKENYSIQGTSFDL
jgi:dihydroflavonol-4-reductase